MLIGFGGIVLVIYLNKDIVVVMYCYGKGCVGFVGLYLEVDESWYC